MTFCISCRKFSCFRKKEKNWNFVYWSKVKKHVFIVRNKQCERSLIFDFNCTHPHVEFWSVITSKNEESNKKDKTDNSAACWLFWSCFCFLCFQLIFPSFISCHFFSIFLLDLLEGVKLISLLFQFQNIKSSLPTPNWSYLNKFMYYITYYEHYLFLYEPLNYCQ